MISVGHAHLLRLVAHIDAAELLEEPHRVLRRGGAPLQLIEGRPVRTGAVGQELRGEHLAERGIVAAPADPGEIEIQCRGALFLVAHRTHRAAARIGAAQHQVADPLGMSGGVSHRDRAALRHAEQRKAFQSKRFHHRFEVGHPVIEA